MSTATGTGFCRVTVVAPHSRIDLALPEDIPLADIYPEILRLAGEPQPEAAPPGWHLVRRDGTVLDGARSLAAHRVLDGELLALRPFADSLPPPVRDDVVDAVAAAVTRDRRRWSEGMLRGAGLTGAAVLLALLGFTLWSADPVRHDTHGLPGILAALAGTLLTALSVVRSRVYQDRASAAVLGLAALPQLLIAGSGIIGPAPGQGAGRLQFLLGCVTVLVASALLLALTPHSDSPFVAAVLASATGTLAGFTAILMQASPTDVAAVCAVTAIAAVAFLPAASARFARLPIGYAAPPFERATSDRAVAGAVESNDPVGDLAPVDEARLAARALRGHEMLVGLVGGCCAVTLVSGAVLCFSASPWAQLLALAVGFAALLRARLFRYTAQVAGLLVTGLATLALLILAFALHAHGHPLTGPSSGFSTGAGIRIVWLTAAIAVGAALLTAIALIVPHRGVSPLAGRLLDLAESAVLLCLVPLCLAVLGVYAAARGMTSQ
ncbi:MAG: type VII secretion integral membrane protein EccD [Streptomycetaceae bacterium]|nr:type VII secretion integral membrane protein EccD [Streptomycetaceae bacterium]